MLVPHGADTRMALAAVPRLAAEDIQVRGVAGSEPPPKAGTAPSPHPTRNPNPNPNTGEAAQPNNAAPGFLSGDN